MNDLIWLHTPSRTELPDWKALARQTGRQKHSLIQALLAAARAGTAAASSCRALEASLSAPRTDSSLGRKRRARRARGRRSRAKRGVALIMAIVRALPD
jgi:hypothetical protein